MVIGPEEPLRGLADARSPKACAPFGPTSAAAQLEGDKAFAKELIATAPFPPPKSASSPSIAMRTLMSLRDAAVVVKAAGLAKGKGVIVCDDPAQGLLALEKIMVKKAFGPAGDVVLVEERLTGQEVSVLCFVDGRSIYLMETAQDYKAIGDGDTGPNTGGMGAKPNPTLDEKLLRQIESEVLVPVVDALCTQGIEYKGVLYAGLMLTAGGPKVLEFNCRFGDPETQPLMLRLRTDLLDVFDAVIEGRLDSLTLEWDPRPAACVVMAARGYPGACETGKPIEGFEQASGPATLSSSRPARGLWAGGS